MIVSEVTLRLLRSLREVGDPPITVRVSRDLVPSAEELPNLLVRPDRPPGVVGVVERFTIVVDELLPAGSVEVQ